jgi:hypothetical protein
MRPRPLDAAEDVRMSAEHDLRACGQGDLRKGPLLVVRLGVQLDPPVEPADDDVGAQPGAARVLGDAFGPGGARRGGGRRESEGFTSE